MSGRDERRLLLSKGEAGEHASWNADEADFDTLFAAAQERKAPSLIALRIDDQPAVGQTERDPNRTRDQFMRGIGARGARAAK